LKLSDIGTSITDLDDLRQRLDDADDTPGDVTLTRNADGFVLDIRIANPLDGKADLDVDGLAGALQLNGTLRMQANVSVHLVVGLNAQGFFIDPNTADPTIVVTGLSADGDLNGGGRLGLVDVDVEGGELATAEGVAITASLLGTGPLNTGRSGCEGGADRGAEK
jgi:hypothetical protein